MSADILVCGLAGILAAIGFFAGGVIAIGIRAYVLYRIEMRGLIRQAKADKLRDAAARRNTP